MNDSLLVTWIILVTATLLSWSLEAAISGAWVGTAVLLVAFFKTRLVIMEFMEVKNSPSALRWVFESWVLAACCIVIIVYWFA